MLELPASAAAWGTPAFAAALRAELEAVPAEALGLQRQVALGGQLADAPVQVTVLASRADGAGVRARVGVFFASVIAGCSCADDPTPVEDLPEYCELELTIHLPDGESRVGPAPT